MIHEADVLSIINTVHAGTMILFQLKDAAVYGLYKREPHQIVYFKVAGETIEKSSPMSFIDEIYSNVVSDSIGHLSFDELMTGLKEKRTRSIWLYKHNREPIEKAFVSVKELRSFLRNHYTCL